MEEQALNLKDKSLLVALITCLFVALGALTYFLFQPEVEQPLPVLGNLPGFSLQDTQGKTVGLEQMRGKVWLADFIYLGCSGPCPFLTRALGDFQKKWKEQGAYFVSFSIDPHDSAKDLAVYAQKAGANPVCWYFLLGPNQSVVELATQGFGLPTIGGPDSQFIHSPRISLVDGEGRIRGFYDGTNENSLQILDQDLGKLLKEKS